MALLDWIYLSPAARCWPGWAWCWKVQAMSGEISSGGGGVAGRWHHGQERRDGVIFPQMFKIELAKSFWLGVWAVSYGEWQFGEWRQGQEALEDLWPSIWRICRRVGALCNLEAHLNTSSFYDVIPGETTKHRSKTVLVFSSTPWITFLASHAELDSCWTCWSSAVCSAHLHCRRHLHTPLCTFAPIILSW